MANRTKSLCSRACHALCAGLLLVSLTTACRYGEPTTSPDEDLAYAPYESPVTLKIAYTYSDIALPEGDFSDNHFLSRYLKEQTGVTIKYAWEANGREQYESKLELAIRSNDLPDALMVNRDQFRRLVQNGMVEDLTDLYPKYASSLIKSIYDATDGKALREASVEGKLYALPNVAIEADAPTYLWIRQDWLDKLKLSPPRTIEEIETIIKAFKERDPDGNGKPDTIGIPIDPLLVFEEKNGVHGLNAVFSSYHAFPKSWILDGNRNVVYGSIQPEAKAALGRLAKWYREGIIDNKFVLRKDIQEVVFSNQTGVIFAPWWAPYWPLSGSVAKDTKAEWRVYGAPVDSNGKFVTNTAPTTDRYLVVRKGYPHPEAALKILNVLSRLERNQDPNKTEADQLKTTAIQLGVQLRNYYPFDLLLDYPDAVEQRHDLLVRALDGELDPADLDPETKALYDDSLLESESPRKNMEAWSSSQAYLLGGAISKTDMIRTESLFYGTTPAMEESWDSLQQLEYKMYLQIITGELPIDAFDVFVEDWKRLGGNRITQEVAASVKQSQEQPSH